MFRCPRISGPSQLETFMANAASNQRFQLSSGVLESFVNTIPLLHPRGHLQVQDIFVTELADYPKIFRGPGKMDGSVRKLGQRRPACRSRRTGRLRRPLCAVPLS